MMVTLHACVKSVKPAYKATRSQLKILLPSKRVPVKKDDGHSACMCEKCKTRIQSHEKSAEDLAAFKEMARCSRHALEPQGPLKRAKATSEEVVFLLKQ